MQGKIYLKDNVNINLKMQEKNWSLIQQNSGFE